MIDARADTISHNSPPVISELDQVLALYHDQDERKNMETFSRKFKDAWMDLEKAAGETTSGILTDEGIVQSPFEPRGNRKD